MPIRIQLSRAKGWRKPPNTTKVDRSTKWGNPYQRIDYQDAPPQLLVDLFRDWLKSGEGRAATIMAKLPELHGKNLACWCPLGSPCHADVLLELANAPIKENTHG